MSNITVPSTSLTEPEIRDLIRQAQKGDLSAKERVLLLYLPLAHKHAKKYDGWGVPYEDLYQEACYGILVALEHYDPDRPESFGTYAPHYINKYIRRNALTNQNSTLPCCYKEDLYQEVRDYIAATEELTVKLGRAPSDRDISEYLNLSVVRIRRLKCASVVFLTASQDIDSISLDAIAGSPDLRPVEQTVIHNAHTLDTSILDEELTAREEEVLARRFGFTQSGQPESWPEISAAMGLHMETLRLAYRVGIAKFRAALGVADKDLK